MNKAQKERIQKTVAALNSIFAAEFTPKKRTRRPQPADPGMVAFKERVRIAKAYAKEHNIQTAEAYKILNPVEVKP